MSFLSVIKSIGHALGVGAAIVTSPTIEPIVEVLPGGALAIAILQAIVAAEQMIPGAQTGPAKKQVVTTVVSANNPTIDSVALSGVIDNIVAALNALQGATASVKK